MTDNLAVGDVVTVQKGQECAGDVGEVEIVLPQAIGVRIIQEESQWRGHLMFFVSSQLSRVEMKPKGGKKHEPDNR